MDSSSKPLLKVSDLTKKYIIKKSFLNKEYFHALDKVSFEVYPSEVVGVVGESGSGKSTIGRIILGLAKPDSGNLYFEDIEISKRFPEELRKDISIVFQDPRTSLNPRFSVYDVISEPLIVNNFPKSEIKERVLEAIRMVQLDESFLERYPHQLSGGQRQRVAVARAIVLNPKLIVADEPTSALDVSIQLQIVNLIKELNRLRGIAFLFISHDINVVANLSNRLIALYRGKIMEQGDTLSVIKDPQHPYTKLLLSSVLPFNPRGRRSFPEIVEDNNSSPKFNGCEFYDRCPFKSQVCLEKPSLKKVGSREVYCHLY